MTLVDELRQAAALMRERAGGCESRRWHWEALGEKRYPQRITSEGNVSLIAECFIDPSHRPFEAEHIASWNPIVALAVADLLEESARYYEEVAAEHGEPGAAFVAGESGGDTDPAINLARAYLEGVVAHAGE